jgi:hypothetical protein
LKMNWCSRKKKKVNCLAMHHVHSFVRFRGRTLKRRLYGTIRL